MLEKLREDIVGEVLSCKFSESMLSIINVLVPVWSEGHASYSAAAGRNETGPGPERLAKESLWGLYHLFDETQFVNQEPFALGSNEAHSSGCFAQ